MNDLQQQQEEENKQKSTLFPIKMSAVLRVASPTLLPTS